jgi:hypothetical protein
MRYSLLLGLLFSINAWAINSYYCLITGKVASVGQTTAQVSVACGPPTSTATREEHIDTPITYTQWIYGIPIDKVGLVPTLRVTFDENSVVTKIEKNGMVLSSLLCNISGMIQVNDAPLTIRLACGAPYLINTIATVKSSVKTVNVWTYNFGPYQQQIIFEFVGDTLTQIKTGNLGN